MRTGNPGTHIHNPVQRYGCEPLEIIAPASTTELAQIIRSSADTRTGLVPVSSTGAHRQTGLCCREPHRRIDLSGWRGIPFLNRRNRVVQIEPGVTYTQLQDALRTEGMTIPMPLAPRRGKSVLAALCERRPVTWSNKQWESSDPMACMEFLFGTGDLFVTGAAGGPGTLVQQRRIGQAQKAPLGPGSTDFHRLVQGSQGSFGIATWLTVRAELAPTVETPRLIGAAQLHDLYDFVYAVQRAKLGEESFILNRTAAAMLLARSDAGHFSALSRALPAYICLQNIAGFERLPRERLSYQQTDIQRWAAASHLELSTELGPVSADTLLAAARSADHEQDWRDEPHGACLSLYFQCTLERSQDLIALAQDVAGQHGRDSESIGVYVQPVVQNRFCEVELLYPYAPDDAATVSRLRMLEKDTYDVLNRATAFFSRPYGLAETEVFRNNPVNTALLAKLKHIFDPARTLNPGKFGL